MPEIILAEHHDQVYSVWAERGMRGLTVAHVDFHCDMRGIMIDRTAGCAMFTSERETTFIDRGNYLAHAIMNGIVADVHWVHDAHGGRGFDLGPVVAYETDMLAPWYRFKQARSGRAAVDFAFRESLLDDWPGPRAGEQLDIDWDGLASIEFAPAHRADLVAQFLAKDFALVPELTFLVYSPGYSDPDRSLFEDFAGALANKFKADVVRLPAAELNTDGEQFGAIRRVIPEPVRNAKRALMRRWRRFESERDLEPAA